MAVAVEVDVAVAVEVGVAVPPVVLLTNGKYIVLAVNINAIMTRTIILTNNFRSDMISPLAERLGDGFLFCRLYEPPNGFFRDGSQPPNYVVSCDLVA